MTVFDYTAFAAMAIVFVFVVWLVIFLGDLPGKIARDREHPQVTAVQVMSWFGLLFTGGIVWIFAMIWAFYDYSASVETAAAAELKEEIQSLRERLEAIESTQAPEEVEEAS